VILFLTEQQRQHDNNHEYYEKNEDFSLGKDTRDLTKTQLSHAVLRYNRKKQYLIKRNKNNNIHINSKTI